jgi:hypothetical protein
MCTLQSILKEVEGVEMGKGHTPPSLPCLFQNRLSFELVVVGFGWFWLFFLVVFPFNDSENRVRLHATHSDCNKNKLVGFPSKSWIRPHLRLPIPNPLLYVKK